MVTIKQRKSRQYKKSRRQNKFKQRYCLKGGDYNAEDSKKTICGLSHGTTMEIFKKIIEEKELKPYTGDFKVTREDRSGELHSFTLNKGIFMQALLTCNNKLSLNIDNCLFEIFLIFSQQLMTDYDFHLSTNWCGGMQFSPAEDIPAPVSINSYKKNQLNQFIDGIKSNTILCGISGSPLPKPCCGQDVFVKTEMVIQETIDIKKYLRMVAICNLSQIQTKQLIDGKRNWYKFEQDVKKKKEEVEQILKANNMEEVKVILMSAQGDICPDDKGTQETKSIDTMLVDKRPDEQGTQEIESIDTTASLDKKLDELPGGKKTRKKKSRKVKKKENKNLKN